MEQIIANNEKIDPLARIQEEIKETVRREQEYRELTSSLSQPLANGAGAVALTENETNADMNTAVKPLARATAATEAAEQPQRNATPDIGNDDASSPSSTPSLASSVNSKEESLDEQHSDDSGISATSTINNNNNIKNIGSDSNSNSNTKIDKQLQLKFNKQNLKLNLHASNAHTVVGAKIQQKQQQQHQQLQQQQQQQQPSAQPRRYIGPNCYNRTPEPPKQKLLATRTLSTPHLGPAVTTPTSKPRAYGAFGGTRGVMERFIASRGKLQLTSATLGTPAAPGSRLVSTINSNIKLPLNVRTALSGGAAEPVAAVSPAIPMPAAPIQRDADGRPLRRGYVPVELKIQRELKDLKSRESELKKIRRIRQSTPDLLDAMSKETLSNLNGAEDEDSDGEHCYGPGKLRSTKSINELSDYCTMSLLSEPEHKYNRSSAQGMRPAKSLAQLCDLPPEQEAPSSHSLIAKWESLIQRNA